MDSVSHVVIGAAIGETFLGKKIGRWGMLLGAVAKSLPDFDLFYTGLQDPRAYMHEHRAHTHSLFFEAIYAIPIAWLLFKLFKQKVSFRRMLVFMLACLWGHSLLDYCTNFGTQLFLPFTDKQYSLYTLSIVDLLFTLPILLLVLIAVFFRDAERRLKLSKAALVWCGLYLAVTFVNKYRAENIAEDSIAKNKIPATAHITNPTMLNNFLWYCVASNDSTLYTGEFSMLHADKPIHWRAYPRHRELLDNFPNQTDAAILKWFGDPYTISDPNADTLNVYAVKFGRTKMSEDSMRETFIFHYKIFQKDGKDMMGMDEGKRSDFNIKEGFIDIWERINGRRN